MNCRLLKVLVLIIPFTGLTSCAIHRFYSPNRTNVPLFKEKNELKASGSVASGEDYEGVDIQGAYSITNNLAIVGNHFYTVGLREDVTKRKYTDFGLGYFKKLNKHQKTHWIFESYAGYGRGQTEEFSEGNKNARLSDVSFNKFYLQSSLGLRTNWLRMHLALRLAKMDFTNITENSGYMSSSGYYPVEREDIDYLRSHRSSILLERSFSIALGYKYVWFEANYVFSENLTAPEMVMAQDNSGVGISLVLPFEEILSKR